MAYFYRRKWNRFRYKKINNIYSKKIRPTKDYIDVHIDVKINELSSRFGNSKTICSNIFSDQKFHPYYRDVDYRKININSTNKKVRKFIERKIPYIAGNSGMANMTCKVLSKLHIPPYSEEGRSFCEAMSAFIVGSGMHSYYEVYKSFNLYAKEIHYPWLFSSKMA
ncbi:hypothetical protein [Candidatus Fukatsuia endosymbiont of Tuberolachnus salignus]|uniref:hypothetical protein n=1 Tax=Candidatus Fukatsuia endosymbiont of Tuberolachnus salignus TaxID=3077957 RepID=UPI00313D78B5